MLPWRKHCRSYGSVTLPQRSCPMSRRLFVVYGIQSKRYDWCIAALLPRLLLRRRRRGNVDVGRHGDEIYASMYARLNKNAERTEAVGY